MLYRPLVDCRSTTPAADECKESKGEVGLTSSIVGPGKNCAPNVEGVGLAIGPALKFARDKKTQINGSNKKV